MLFNSSEVSDVHRVFLPVSNSMVGFAISEKSNHAVSTVYDGERFHAGVLVLWQQLELMISPLGCERRCGTSISLLWLPELTSSLVNAGWKQLDWNFHLTRTSYGTARVLHRDPEEPRRLAAYVNASVCYPAFHDAIQVELLPEALARQYAGPGFRFLERGGNSRGRRVRPAGGRPWSLGTHTNAGADDLLPHQIPAPRISSDDNQVDVSFSDPGLPFSWRLFRFPRPKC